MTQMQSKPTLQKIVQHEYFFTALLIIIQILVGFFIVSDYGPSTDEPLSWKFGTRALKMYTGGNNNLSVNYSHGGGYLIPAKVGQLFFSSIFPSWKEPTAWHFVNFIFFQAAIVFIFMLARKFMGIWAANFTTLIFTTQPLIWGHAFMNPKDIPFLTLILGTFVLGFNFADHLQETEADAAEFTQSLRNKSTEETRSKHFKTKLILVLIVIGGYLIFQIGIAVAGQNTELHYDRTLGWVDKTFILTAILGSMVILFPQSGKLLLQNRKLFTSPNSVFLPALILGLCISARTMGLAAIVVVAVYMFYKNGKKAIFPFVLYLFTAGIVSFVLWPDLWDAPIPDFIKYLENIVEYGWDWGILFEGIIYSKDNYPSYYLPKLIMLKLTIPALILAGAGIIVAGIRVWKKTYDWMLTGILAAWFFGPIVLAILVHPVIYNNFRHFLFILPPVFIFAGISADYLFEKLNQKAWRVLLIILILLPGIIGITTLHPYEYIYFNEITGGVEGAFRVYELDYWFISNLEAMEYLNNHVPPNSTIAINLGKDLVSWYAREDIKVKSHHKHIVPESTDFLVANTNLNDDLILEELFPDLNLIHTIERDGIPIVKIYEYNSK